MFFQDFPSVNFVVSAFWFRVYKTKKSQQPIQLKEGNNFQAQWELKVRTIQLPEAQGNVGDQIMIGFF